MTNKYCFKRQFLIHQLIMVFLIFSLGLILSCDKNRNKKGLSNPEAFTTETNTGTNDNSDTLTESNTETIADLSTTTDPRNPPTLNDLWEGRAVLGTKTLVSFEGNPRTHEFQTTTRVALIEGADGVIYAYFRQYIAPPENQVYETYLAVSSDGGLHFEVQPDPIISPHTVPDIGNVVTAYDSDVIKRNDGYYMVFECAIYGKCNFSACIAFSVDGKSNWNILGVPVCSLDPNYSASVPNFVQKPDGTTYLQWAQMNIPQEIVTHHQVLMGSDLSKEITTNTNIGQLPQSTDPKFWDSRNFGSGNVINEGEYYYLFYEGANSYGCNPTTQSVTSQWGIGMARTNNLNEPSSWEKSKLNPLMMAIYHDSCWVAYPEIIKIKNRYYLYYYEASTYFGTAKTTFRQEIVWGN